MIIFYDEIIYYSFIFFVGSIKGLQLKFHCVA